MRDAKILLKRNIGRDGQIQNSSATQGEGASLSRIPPTSHAIMRAMLITAAVNDWKLRRIDFEHAYLQTLLTERFASHCLKITGYFPTHLDCRRRPSTRLHWVTDIKAMHFEQFHADQPMLSRLLSGEVVTLITIYVYDILFESKRGTLRSKRYPTSVRAPGSMATAKYNSTRDYMLQGVGQGTMAFD